MYPHEGAATSIGSHWFPRKKHYTGRRASISTLAQNIIAEDPSVLGPGDLILKDKERIQPKAGALTELSRTLEIDSIRGFRKNFWRITFAKAGTVTCFSVPREPLAAGRAGRGVALQFRFPASNIGWPDGISLPSNLSRVQALF